MSFKSLDLQVSIPRTPDASSMQSQQMLRQAADQTKLAAASAEQTIELRHRNTEVEESSGQTIRDREGRRQNGQQKGRGQGERGTHGGARAREPGSAHPYKGKHIDITL